MLNEVLHAFFFWMPAVVAVAVSSGITAPWARRILFWGGLMFALVIGAAVLGMLLCDGRSLQVYSNCAGGLPIERIFAAAHPVFSAATYLYLFLGPTLAGLAYVIEWRYGRKAVA